MRISDWSSDVCSSYLLALLRLDLGLTFGLDRLLVSLAAFGVVVDFHRHDLVGGELRRTVLAEQPDRVGAALAAMAHHVHIAFAVVLQGLEFLRRRPEIGRAYV